MFVHSIDTKTTFHIDSQHTDTHNGVCDLFDVKRIVFFFFISFLSKTHCRQKSGTNREMKKKTNTHTHPHKNTPDSIQ